MKLIYISENVFILLFTYFHIIGVNFIIIDLIKESGIRSSEESMSYQFECNAKKFDIIFEISDIVKGLYPHTGITAREGICIMYRLSGTKNWYNINMFFRESQVTIDMSDYVDDSQTYEILIYGPIIAKVSKLQISIPEENTLNITGNNKRRNITVAGGPISFGIGCTTAKSIFANVIERKMEGYVHHITYNNFNYLEDISNYYENNDNAPVADIAILEVDYFPQKESNIEEILPKVITMMKQRCKYLIGWYAIPESKSFKKIIANNTIKEYIQNQDIHMLDLSYLYSGEYLDECTYNNFVINDTGHLLIYREIEKEIRRLMKWSI